MNNSAEDERAVDGFDANRFQEFTFWAMGTENAVQLLGAPEQIDGMTPEKWCGHELERYEQCWSRFRSDSELNTFLCIPGRQFGLSNALLIALDCAARAYAATNGLFDARIRTSLNELGYSRPYRELPLGPDGNRTGIPILAGQPTNRKPTNMHHERPPQTSGFAVDLFGRWASVDQGVQLDLGGVGKGLAADLLATSLVAAGAEGACVSLGGDIRTVGIGPQNGGWEIPLPHPMFDNREFATQRCVNAAIVMSTVGLRRWGAGTETDTVEHSRASPPHRPQPGTGLGDSEPMLHHLIDPRTQRPTNNGVHSVAAFGPQAWWAEVGAKAALIAGPDEAVSLLERLGLDGWVFLTDGTVATTALIDQSQLKLVPC
jgi:FAD:protein FMN transferase